VIHLGIGEPKNKAPITAILSSAARLNAGDVKYTPTDGTPSLKRIRYTEENYDKFAPEGLFRLGRNIPFNVLFASNPRMKSSCSPYWVSYPKSKMCYGIPVVVTRDGTFYPRMEDRTGDQPLPGDHRQRRTTFRSFTRDFSVRS
jgi:aspartate/methionine/tyrosine aminotransferase